MDENPYRAPLSEAGKQLTVGSLVEKAVALGCWGVAVWLVKFSAGLVMRDDVRQMFEMFPIALPLYLLVLLVMPPVGFAVLGFSSWTGSSRLMMTGLAILVLPAIGWIHMVGSNT
jgi:hypothetical protein